MIKQKKTSRKGRTVLLFLQHHLATDYNQLMQDSTIPLKGHIYSSSECAVSQHQSNVIHASVDTE